MGKATEEPWITPKVEKSVRGGTRRNLINTPTSRTGTQTHMQTHTRIHTQNPDLRQPSLCVPYVQAC